MLIINKIMHKDFVREIWEKDNFPQNPQDILILLLNILYIIKGERYENCL